jgi:hypothetical protein
MGKGTIAIESLDHDVLVHLRRSHQTRQAALGSRTQSKTTNNGLSPTVRGQILSAMHQALRTQEDRAVGTGIERSARWRAPAHGGRDGIIDGSSAPSLANGNAANAVATASAITKRVSFAYIVSMFLL